MDRKALTLLRASGGWPAAGDGTALAALQRSALWLLVAVCAGVQWLPPLRAPALASASGAAFVGATVALSLAMHWLQLARAARRAHAPLGPSLALAVLLAPLGGLAALALLALSLPPAAVARPR